MPSINSAFKWFFKPAEFEKLSPGKKWAVAIVSLLPAVTIVGLISSPFIWRAMVNTLSDKKISKLSSENSHTTTANTASAVANKTGITGGAPIPPGNQQASASTPTAGQIHFVKPQLSRDESDSESDTETDSDSDSSSSGQSSTSGQKSDTSSSDSSSSSSRERGNQQVPTPTATPGQIPVGKPKLSGDESESESETKSDSDSDSSSSGQSSTTGQKSDTGSDSSSEEESDFTIKPAKAPSPVQASPMPTFTAQTATPAKAQSSEQASRAPQPTTIPTPTGPTVTPTAKAPSPWQASPTPPKPTPATAQTASPAPSAKRLQEELKELEDAGVTIYGPEEKANDFTLLAKEGNFIVRRNADGSASLSYYTNSGVARLGLRFQSDESILGRLKLLKMWPIEKQSADAPSASQASTPSQPTPTQTAAPTAKTLSKPTSQTPPQPTPATAQTTSPAPSAKRLQEELKELEDAGVTIYGPEEKTDDFTLLAKEGNFVVRRNADGSASLSYRTNSGIRLGRRLQSHESILGILKLLEMWPIEKQSADVPSASQASTPSQPIPTAAPTAKTPSKPTSPTSPKPTPATAQTATPAPSAKRLQEELKELEDAGVTIYGPEEKADDFTLLAKEGNFVVRRNADGSASLSYRTNSGIRLGLRFQSDESILGRLKLLKMWPIEKQSADAPSASARQKVLQDEIDALKDKIKEKDANPKNLGYREYWLRKTDVEGVFFLEYKSSNYKIYQKRVSIRPNMRENIQKVIDGIEKSIPLPQFTKPQAQPQSSPTQAQPQPPTKGRIYQDLKQKILEEERSLRSAKVPPSEANIHRMSQDAVLAILFDSGGGGKEIMDAGVKIGRNEANSNYKGIYFDTDREELILEYNIPGRFKKQRFFNLDSDQTPIDQLKQLSAEIDAELVNTQLDFFRRFVTANVFQSEEEAKSRVSEGVDYAYLVESPSVYMFVLHNRKGKKFICELNLAKDNLETVFKQCKLQKYAGESTPNDVIESYQASIARKAYLAKNPQLKAQLETFVLQSPENFTYQDISKLQQQVRVLEKPLRQSIIRGEYNDAETKEKISEVLDAGKQFIVKLNEYNINLF